MNPLFRLTCPHLKTLLCACAVIFEGISINEMVASNDASSLFHGPMCASMVAGFHGVVCTRQLSCASVSGSTMFSLNVIGSCGSLTSRESIFVSLSAVSRDTVVDICAFQCAHGAVPSASV